MTTSESATIAAELALRVAGRAFPRLSTFGATARTEDAYYLPATDVLEPSFYLLDVTVSDGRVHLIEANGSNGALSSTAAMGDRLRAEHMAFAFHAKSRPAGSVVAVLCYQEGFLHLPEFFSRADRFRACLGRTCNAVLRGWDEALGDEDVSVVCGSTAEMASQIRRLDRGLSYRDRPIVFAANPNLLPELVRQGVIASDNDGYNIDHSIYHEGRGATLVHDKAAQQDTACGSEISPLAWRLVHRKADWLTAVRWFRERNLVCVAKMHAGSGGSGIELLTPSMSDDETLLKLDQLLASARTKYGANAEETAYPVALFEFAKADPFLVNGQPHLWDLRVMTLVYPPGVYAYPCVVRLCPAPFDGSWSRDTWLSNLSGRNGDDAIRFMRSPAHLTFGDTGLRRILKGCAEWSANAARADRCGSRVRNQQETSDV